jgi:hypothetical protein
VAYTTTALVKAYVGASGTADDTLIDALVISAGSIIETYTGRVFDGTSTSTRNFDAISDVDGRTLYFDDDIASITTVTNIADGTSETIGTSAYVTHPRNDTPYWGISLLASANKEWSYQDDPEGGITVLGSWRYSETAPGAVAHAAKRLTAFLYRQKDSNSDLDRPLLTNDGVTLLPSQLPNDVKQLLEPYRKRVVR